MKILKWHSLIFSFMAIMCVFSLTLPSVEARPKPKKMFEQKYEDQGLQMSLKGTARKWAFFMKIFTAGLYMEEQTPTKDVMTDVAKRIEVLYHYPIPGSKLAKYTKDQMKLNLNKDEYLKIKKELPKLDQYFVDLKPGDRYALSYHPGKGTAFIYNGKEVGLIEGVEFSKGIFGVWLGDNPMDRHVKYEILGIPHGGYQNQSLLIEDDGPELLKS